ncbi:MAG TPA: fibronectin type III domain-containing protein [Burkholderiales bacterium]
MATAAAKFARALPALLLVALVGTGLAACSGSSDSGGGSIGGPGTDPGTDPGDQQPNPDPDDPGTPTDPTSPTDPGPQPQPDPGNATDTTVSLTWAPNTDPIAGYRVYYGPTAESATTLAVQLDLATHPFGDQPPHVEFNAGTDLGLKHGDTVCFRLRAYNAANVMSDWSDAACGTI